MRDDERIEALDGHRTYLVYCRSGRRSGIAEATLREKGFTNLENVGGFEQLRATGLPTTP